MHRRLRVCRLLPPRKARGARSMTMTRAPCPAAASAAQSAGVPPPRTATSERAALHPRSVLHADDARNAADDVLGLPPLDLGVDDARQEDAGVADDDVDRRDGLRRVVGEGRVAVERVRDEDAKTIVA